MKLKILLCLSFFSFIQINAQQNTPPPPGTSPVYAIDLDNDGYTIFDIGYYIDYYERPLMEGIHQVSSSGYNFIFYNSNDVLSPLMYTNISIEEICSIHYEYTGSGPIFQPMPPQYWLPPTQGGIKLMAMPYNGDLDNDGILNIDEDANHNINLMDDDDDHDGIINLKDDTNNLAFTGFANSHFAVYPNPATNGSITLESNVKITSLAIHDLLGKCISDHPITSTMVSIDKLIAGVYFFTFRSEAGDFVRKIVVR